MARTTVTVQTATRAGVTPVYNAATSAATGGDAFANNGRVLVEVVNTGVETTLTIQTPGTVDGLSVAERTVVIPAATGRKLIGPFPTYTYNQTDGMVYFDWSQVTGVTFALFKAS